MLEGRTVAEVARLVGASWSAVKRWKVAVEKYGLDGLAAKPHPGKPRRLSQMQRQKLVELLKRGPLKAGYETNLWTCPRVAELIRQHFGVAYHPAPCLESVTQPRLECAETSAESAGTR